MSNYVDTKTTMSEDEIIEYLVNSLDDERKDFATFAIRQLKHYHSALIVEKLQKIVDSESNIEHTIKALNSLRRRKPNHHTKEIALRKLLSEKEEIRKAATNFLLEFDSQILPDLEEMIEQHLPKYAVSNIIWILGQIGKPDTIFKLNDCNSIKSGNFKQIIDNAVESIKKRYPKLLFEELKEKE